MYSLSIPSHLVTVILLLAVGHIISYKIRGASTWVIAFVLLLNPSIWGSIMWEFTKWPWTGAAFSIGGYNSLLVLEVCVQRVPSLSA